MKTNSEYKQTERNKFKNRPLEYRLRRTPITQLKVLLDIMNGNSELQSRSKGGLVSALSRNGLVIIKGRKERRLLWEPTEEILSNKLLIEKILE